MVWTPFLVRGISQSPDMLKGKGRYSGGFEDPLGGTPFEEDLKPRNGLRTIGVLGKKGGQRWGETLVITMVEQGAGYYPPSVNSRSLCTGSRVSVSFYVSLRDLRSNPL